jgi:hypothetical protein
LARLNCEVVAGLVKRSQALLIAEITRGSMLFQVIARPFDSFESFLSGFRLWEVGFELLFVRNRSSNLLL